MFNFKLYFKLIVISIFCFVGSVLAKPTIIVGADEWVDYTAADGSGIYFELLKRAFPDYQLKFKIAPFQQTLTSFEQGDLHIAVGVYKDDLPNALYPNWYLDLEYPVVAFVDKHKTINHISDISKLHLAWLKGYNFGKYVLKADNITLIDNIDQGFELLAKQKIDAVVDYPYNATEAEKQRYHMFQVLPSRHIYIALQHNRAGLLLARQFDKAMRAMRNNGTLARLFGNDYPHTEFAQFPDVSKPIKVYTNSLSMIKPMEQMDKHLSLAEKINLNFIFEKLNNYLPSYYPLKDISLLQQLQQQENTCIADLINTQKRANQFIVSQPFSLFLGLRLYSLTPLAVNAQGKVNLVELLSQPNNYRLGTASGRSYGEQLDLQLQKINRAKIVESPVKISTLFKQLQKKRFDLLIEYPSEAERHWPKEQPPLYSYEISGADPYILAHLMCSKSINTKIFVTQFNQALNELYNSVIFFDSQYRRIPKANRAIFKKYFDRAFANSEPLAELSAN